MKNSIPKRIFYVWGKDEPKKRDVNLCLLSWHQLMPDYEIIEINEASTEYFNFQKELEHNKYFKMVYERKMYAFVSDYIRLKVLYDNGGIYLDTDVCVLKRFDDLLSNKAFVGIEGNKEEIGMDWVEPAILGAQKGNTFIKEIIEFYQEEIMKTPLFVLPDIFSKFLAEKYNITAYPNKLEQEIINLDDITIYPEKYFIPYRINEQFNFDCIEDETYTMHLWNGSWNNSEICYFQRNKHRMPIWLLDIAVKLRKFIHLIFSLENTMINGTKTKFLMLLGGKFKIAKY